MELSANTRISAHSATLRMLRLTKLPKWWTQVKSRPKSISNSSKQLRKQPNKKEAREKIAILESTALRMAADTCTLKRVRSCVSMLRSAPTKSVHTNIQSSFKHPKNLYANLMVNARRKDVLSSTHQWWNVNSVSIAQTTSANSSMILPKCPNINND